MPTTTLSPGDHRKLIRLAHARLKQLKKRDARYDEECREYARQGFRPHYCRHGRNLWVDYDVICGACEDGLSNYQLALIYAHDVMHAYKARDDARAAMFGALLTRNRGLTPGAHASLATVVNDWVREPIELAFTELTR